MADKPEFVDMISEATRQSRRRTPRVVDLLPSEAAKETSRLGHRSERLEQWRVENFTPWKIKPWKFKDWS